MAAEEVAVEQPLYVLRHVDLERLEPRPGLSLRRGRLPRASEDDEDAKAAVAFAPVPAGVVGISGSDFGVSSFIGSRGSNR